MSNPFLPISISLSPNVQSDDLDLAQKLLNQTKQNIDFADAPRQLENQFKKYLGVKHASSFNSGRSSLMAILNSLELPPGSQVLLQALTCNAAVNPIRWSGLEPIFVDCDDTYNLDVADLEKKITPRSRAVIVQHTFGLPADMDAIARICQKNNLILIEDCAHSLGATYHQQKVGTFGKAAFFSFSRDKIISCVYGGIAATNDDQLAQKIATYQEKIGFPPMSWTRQQLRHPLLMNRLILPTYSILGKYLLVLFQQSNVLSKAVHWKEKRGLCPDYFPRRLPGALAVLALHQLEKLDKYNSHRQKIAQVYFQTFVECFAASSKKSLPFNLPLNFNDRQSVFLRFTIRANNAAQIIKKAWSKNLLLGDWYRTPVDPFDTLPEAIDYQKGSCPRAEEFAGKMINLPTHINISQDQAQKIVDFLFSASAKS